MKKPLTILVSIILVGLNLQMQPQNVFPTKDAIWNIQLSSIYGSRDYQYYGLTGDTIINDTIYSKLYLLNDTTLIIDHNDVYIGGFRQEEGKVWFRPHFPNLQYPIETILYDFSKNVGDTIWHNLIDYGEWFMNKNIAASVIYSIIDDNGIRTYKTEQYLVDANNNLYHSFGLDSWMEGVGSVENGLFFFLVNYPMSAFYFYKLACFKQDDKVIYLDNSQCNKCFCYQVGRINESNYKYFNIVCENNLIKIRGDAVIFPCIFRLFLPSGQLFLDKELKTNQEEIQFSKKGIWIYQIKKDKDIIQTGKLIIK